MNSETKDLDSKLKANLSYFLRVEKANHAIGLELVMSWEVLPI